MTISVLSVAVLALWQLRKLPTKWMRIAARVLAIVAIVSAFWNLYQEGADIFTFFLWCIFPIAGALLCLKSERRGWVQGSFVYVVVVTCLYVLYALNGPTSTEEEGAQHMHVILFPILLGIATALLVFYALFARWLHRRTEAKVASHGATGDTQKSE